MFESVTRRSFISAAAAVAATAGVARAHGSRRDDSFRHGVASGDPLQDRVILWTRVTPADLHDDVDVKWSVAKDPGLRRVVAAGRARTNIWRDFTVKIDVDGLEPGRTYYYQFSAHGDRSPIGRTRTLPQGKVDAARLALASCSNLPFGLFNVYALIARRNDLDAVLHLGDYIYEYANGSFGDGTLLNRVPMPDKEIVTLADYRQRHAQYKTDPDLQAAHRQHPFICVWDDHEITNDSWEDGAENHNPELGEGDYAVRKRAAIRAYFEWMPIREFEWRPKSRIFRSFRVGSLVDLLMLDTRNFGRSEQSHALPVGSAGFPANDPTANDPARSLLGLEQEAWLDERLVHSQSRGAKWRLLGQQVMMAQLSPSGGQTLFNLDQWDGYIPARERLFTSLRDNKIDNVVVVTGDIHTSWANELTSNPWNPAAYDPATGKGVVGVEFVTPGVTSPGIVDPVEAAQTAAFVRSVSPHMKFAELNKRGYVLLDIDRERVQSEFWHVATIDAPSRTETLAGAFVTEDGANSLKPVPSASAVRNAIDPAP